MVKVSRFLFRSEPASMSVAVAAAVILEQVGDRAEPRRRSSGTPALLRSRR
jgi:hypothetical protein